MAAVMRPERPWKSVRHLSAFVLFSFTCFYVWRGGQDSSKNPTHDSGPGKISWNKSDIAAWQLEITRGSNLYLRIDTLLVFWLKKRLVLVVLDFQKV